MQIFQISRQLFGFCCHFNFGHFFQQSHSDGKSPAFVDLSPSPFKLDSSPIPQNFCNVSSKSECEQTSVQPNPVGRINRKQDGQIFDCTTELIKNRTAEFDQTVKKTKNDCNIYPVYWREIQLICTRYIKFLTRCSFKSKFEAILQL